MPSPGWSRMAARLLLAKPGPGRQRMLAAIQRIVRGECQAAGSPRDPDFETLDSFPLTDNDPGTTSRVAAAFGAHFGDRAMAWDQQTASEDFRDIPRGRHSLHLLGPRGHRPPAASHQHLSPSSSG